ncbi:hypothetical protein OAD60_00210 [Candidatus Thioglobus sp.]|nr:hypothetical protein [Candidatus Thioglobus sp.]
MNREIKFFTSNDFIKSDIQLYDFISSSENSNISPFSDETIDFINNFSKSILLDRNSRKFPELVVLADFFSKRNTKKMFNRISDENNNYVFLPLGKTFHIAPSNVDTIFLYSSLIALMCGNICLIRLSSQHTEQINFAIEKLNLVLSQHSKFLKRLFVFNYEHNNEITRRISSHIDLRVIWGGDNSVKEIRSIPLNPMARELTFPNRFSFTVIKSKEVISNQSDLNSMVHSFIKDTIYFDQQACSSPRSLIWLGSQTDNKKAQDIFWKNYLSLLTSKDYQNTSGMMMDRFVASNFLSAINLSKRVNSAIDYPTRLKVHDLNSQILREFHPGNGLFYEIEVQNIDQIAKQVKNTDQTLTYFGLDNSEISDLLSLISNRGLDRILPIGEALDFSVIWDGYDLIEAFTRKVVIR